MDSEANKFDSKIEMMKYAREFVQKKFGYNIENVLVKSLMLKEMKSQKKLSSYQ